MLFALLYVGTFWFYVACIVPFLLVLAFVEFEKSGLAFTTLLLTAALFVAFGDPKIVPWLLANPIRIVEAIGIYIVAGIVWGVVKWFFFVLKQRDIYNQIRNTFLENEDEFRASVTKRPSGTGFEIKPAGFDSGLFKHYLKERSIHLSGFPPSAAEHKGRIIFWMAYWPFSALWTLIHDPITRFYRFLYRRFVGVFEAISRSMFKKFHADMT